jgi:cytoskeleton protein RodZ
MDVGAQLRTARLRRGLDLAAVATATRVPRPRLEQLDNNQFDGLPPGIIVKGYLRAYAAEVGLDPEQIVRQYMLQRFGAKDEDLPFVRPEAVDGRASHPGRALLLEVLAVGAAMVAFYQFQGGSDREPDRDAMARLPPRPPVADAGRIEPPPSVVEDLFSEGDGSEGEGDETLSRITDMAVGVRLLVRPSGPCWVSAIADDRRVVYRLLQRGDEAEAIARKHLVLRVGDPGTFLYWLNGAPGRPLGPPGSPVSISIRADNVQTFLAAQRSPYALPVALPRINQDE